MRFESCIDPPAEDYPWQLVHAGGWTVGVAGVPGALMHKRLATLEPERIHF
jgi:hypothetical protein